MLSGKFRSIGSFTAIVLVCLGLVGCAAKSLVSQGDEALELGNYYTAALRYIEALHIKPTHSKALSRLMMVAKQAYEQKLMIAEGYKARGNLEVALREYKELRNFLLELKHLNALNFVPIDIDEEIAHLKTGAAEAHYRAAERLLEQGLYRKAIKEYKKALKFVDPYKDSRRKISECYYRIADGLVQEGSFREAVENYLNAETVTPGYKDARRKAAEVLYQLGLYFLSRGYCRNAYEEFSKVRGIISDYKDVAAKQAKAEQCATVKIAFARFDNPTGRTIAGMALGDFISDAIRAEVRANASKFVKFLDRDELGAILAEQKMAASGLVEGALIIGRLKGVQYLIFGKITQVYVSHEGLRKMSKRAKCTYYYTISYTDEKGKRKNRTVWKEGVASYDVYTDSRTISLSGSIKVIEVGSGEVKIYRQINSRVTDKIKYAENLRLLSSLEQLLGYSIEILEPDEFRKLKKARRELKDEDTMTRELIDEIASTVAAEILNTVDLTPDVSDPKTLPISWISRQ